MRFLVLLLAFLVCDTTLARDAGAKARGDMRTFWYPDYPKPRGNRPYYLAPIAIFNNYVKGELHVRRR